MSVCHILAVLVVQKIQESVPFPVTAGSAAWTCEPTPTVIVQSVPTYPFKKTHDNHMTRTNQSIFLIRLDGNNLIVYTFKV